MTHVNLTPDDLDLIATALRTAATQRSRTARAVAAELGAARRTGTDVRSGAVKVVDVLAEGHRLDVLADHFEDAKTRARSTIPASTPPTFVALDPSTLPAMPSNGPAGGTVITDPVEADKFLRAALADPNTVVGDPDDDDEHPDEDPAGERDPEAITEGLARTLANVEAAEDEAT